VDLQRDLDGINCIWFWLTFKLPMIFELQIYRLIEFDINKNPKKLGLRIHSIFIVFCIEL
jgi:hypothetical protein